MDGIVYGVTVSLGFATLENIFYVYGQGFNDPYSIAILRSISAIPAGIAEIDLSIAIE